MGKTSGTELSGAAAKWARRVEGLKQSGLSIRAFAEQEGLKAGSLSFWKWKLAKGARQTETRVRFIELTTATTGSRQAATGFEVVLRSRREVRVPGGFDAGELARLVGVLEEVGS